MEFEKKRIEEYEIEKSKKPEEKVEDDLLTLE